MSQRKSEKPVLIRDEGGIQTFLDPDTGKEFSTTVSRPIEGVERNNRLVILRCSISTDSNLTKRLSDLRSVIGSDVALDNRQMLAEVHSKGTVTIVGLERWVAEQRVFELRKSDIVVELIDE